MVHPAPCNILFCSVIIYWGMFYILFTAHTWWFEHLFGTVCVIWASLREDQGGQWVVFPYVASSLSVSIGGALVLYSHYFTILFSVWLVWLLDISIENRYQNDMLSVACCCVCSRRRSIWHKAFVEYVTSRCQKRLSQARWRHVLVLGFKQLHCYISWKVLALHGLCQCVYLYKSL